MGKWYDAAKEQRKIFDEQGAFLTDEEALTVKAAYRQWEELVALFMVVKPGFRFVYEDQMYKTMQPEYTFVDTYVPGTQGTESLFAKIDEKHAGTLEDPIPYDGNMALENGKYYCQDGVTYLCNRDTVNPVYNPLSELVGLYVETVN